MNNVSDVKDKFAQLRKGLLELAVLRIVASHQVYAADILNRLGRTDFVTGEGTLYPLLSRLRREKYLEYEWVESETGPPRKYYQLTETGQTHLQELNDYWEQINQALEQLGSPK